MVRTALLLCVALAGCLGGDANLRAQATHTIEGLDFDRDRLWDAVAAAIGEEGFHLKTADKIRGEAASEFRPETRVSPGEEFATKVRASVKPRASGCTVTIYAGRYRRAAARGLGPEDGWTFVAPNAAALQRIEVRFRRRIGL